MDLVSCSAAPAPYRRGRGRWAVRRAGLTHGQFAHDVRAAASAWAKARGTLSEAEAGRLLAAKLVYGAGDGRYRGVCHYSAWANGMGHCAEWKRACERLGPRRGDGRWSAVRVSLD